MGLSRLLFSLFWSFQYNWQLIYVLHRTLPMAGFEPRTSGIWLLYQMSHNHCPNVSSITYPLISSIFLLLWKILHLFKESFVQHSLGLVCTSRLQIKFTRTVHVKPRSDTLCLTRCIFRRCNKLGHSTVFYAGLNEPLKSFFGGNV